MFFLIMNQQLTLFNTDLFTNYDDSIEPPDPDQYPTLEGYECAYAAWARKYPHLVDDLQGMSEDEGDREQHSTVLEWRGFTGELFISKTSTQLTISHGSKICLTAEDDSITQHEAAVDWFHQEVEQLVYYGVGNVTTERQQPYNSVLEQVDNDTPAVVPEHSLVVPEQVQWVEEYCPSNRKDNHYYRYCYKDRGKIKHRHIPGGNLRSPIAQRKKAAVESAIAAGKSPAEIEKIIKNPKKL